MNGSSFESDCSDGSSSVEPDFEIALDQTISLSLSQLWIEFMEWCPSMDILALIVRDSNDCQYLWFVRCVTQWQMLNNISLTEQFNDACNDKITCLTWHPSSRIVNLSVNDGNILQYSIETGDIVDCQSFACYSGSNRNKTQKIEWISANNIDLNPNAKRKKKHCIDADENKKDANDAMDENISQSTNSMHDELLSCMVMSSNSSNSNFKNYHDANGINNSKVNNNNQFKRTRTNSKHKGKLSQDLMQVLSNLDYEFYSSEIVSIENTYNLNKELKKSLTFDYVDNTRNFLTKISMIPKGPRINPNYKLNKIENTHYFDESHYKLDFLMKKYENIFKSQIMSANDSKDEIRNASNNSVSGGKDRIETAEARLSCKKLNILLTSCDNYGVSFYCFGKFNVGFLGYEDIIPKADILENAYETRKFDIENDSKLEHERSGPRDEMVGRVGMAGMTDVEEEWKMISNYVSCDYKCLTSLQERKRVKNGEEMDQLWLSHVNVSIYDEYRHELVFLLNQFDYVDHLICYLNKGICQDVKTRWLLAFGFVKSKISLLKKHVKDWHQHDLNYNREKDEMDAWKMELKHNLMVGIASQPIVYFAQKSLNISAIDRSYKQFDQFINEIYLIYYKNILHCVEELIYRVSQIYSYSLMNPRLTNVGLNRATMCKFLQILKALYIKLNQFIIIFGDTVRNVKAFVIYLKYLCCLHDHEDVGTIEFDNLDCDRIIAAIDYDIDPGRVGLLLDNGLVPEEFNVLLSVEANEWTTNSNNVHNKDKRESIMDIIEKELKEDWKKYDTMSLGRMMQDIQAIWKPVIGGIGQRMSGLLQNSSNMEGALLLHDMECVNMSGINANGLEYELIVNGNDICFTTCPHPNVSKSGKINIDINSCIPCYLACMPVLRKLKIKSDKSKNGEKDKKKVHKKHKKQNKKNASLTQKSEEDEEDEEAAETVMRLVFIRTIPKISNKTGDIIFNDKDANETGSMWTDDMKEFEALLQQPSVDLNVCEREVCIVEIEPNVIEIVDSESEDSDIDVASNEHANERNLAKFVFEEINIIEMKFIDWNRLAILCSLRSGVVSQTCLLTLCNLNWLQFSSCTKLDFEVTMAELAFDTSYSLPIEKISICNEEMIKKQIFSRDCHGCSLKVSSVRNLAAVGCKRRNDKDVRNEGGMRKRFNRLIIVDIGSSCPSAGGSETQSDSESDSESDSDSVSSTEIESDTDNGVQRDGGADDDESGNGAENGSSVNTESGENDDNDDNASDAMLEID